MKLPKMELRDRWSAAHLSAAYDAHEAAYHDNLPIPAPVPLVAVLLALVVQLGREVVCGVRGHVVECESTIGCDSGSEHFSCSRCGWSHEVVYY